MCWLPARDQPRHFVMSGDGVPVRRPTGIAALRGEQKPGSSQLSVYRRIRKVYQKPVNVKRLKQ